MCAEAADLLSALVLYYYIVLYRILGGTKSLLRTYEEKVPRWTNAILRLVYSTYTILLLRFGDGLVVV